MSWWVVHWFVRGRVSDVVVCDDVINSISGCVKSIIINDKVDSQEQWLVIKLV